MSSHSDDSGGLVQRNVQPAAPCEQTDAPNRQDRDAHTGRFLPGNGAAVMTALRAGRAHLPEVLAVLEGRARDFLQASLADDGGEADCPTRRRAQHQYRASLHLQILRLTAALETHGLFDRRGRLRLAWLSKLESLMREARAFDVTLGLERRARPVPTPTDWIEGKA